MLQKTTIHIVTNAHLDPAWLWDWREGMNEGIATCHAMVDLMEESPDVTFARGESLLYEHIEQHDPDLFRRIERLIEEGRWEISEAAICLRFEACELSTMAARTPPVNVHLTKALRQSDE